MWVFYTSRQITAPSRQALADVNQVPVARVNVTAAVKSAEELAVLAEAQKAAEKAVEKAAQEAWEEATRGIVQAAPIVKKAPETVGAETVNNEQVIVEDALEEEKVAGKVVEEDIGEEQIAENVVEEAAEEESIAEKVVEEGEENKRIAEKVVEQVAKNVDNDTTSLGKELGVSLNNNTDTAPSPANRTTSTTTMTMSSRGTA